MDRTDEDINAGILRFQVGKDTVSVPTRKIAAAREWKASVQEAIGGFLTTDLRDVATMGGMVGMASEKYLALAAEYDTSGQLTKERLERECDDAQAYAIFRSMLEVSYPMVRDIRGVLAVLTPLLLAPEPAASPGPKPTNGRSHIGDSPPARSKKPSTTRS